MLNKVIERIGICERDTSETQIKVKINLDGNGVSKIDTPIGFLNHMLNLFCKHGGFDLDIYATGDTHVDCHHIVEDIGIALGSAINVAISKNMGFRRYANIYTPMDESLSRVTLDISGRPYLVFDSEFTVEKLGNLDTEMIEEFFIGLINNGKITAHITLIYGRNNHHMVESIFKGFARALKEAVVLDGVLASTKGLIEL